MANPTQAQIDKLTTNLTRWDSIVNGSSGTTVALDTFTVNTVAYYLQQLTATNPRGAWATSTAYALKDIVVQSSVVYICTVAHTSGTFATDLGNGYWAVQQLDVLSPISFANDFTVDTNVFHVDSTNNRVGIGTTTPQTTLTIRKTHAAPTATAYNGALLIHDEPNGVLPHLNMGIAYDSGANYGWLQVNNSTHGAYNLVLQSAGGGLVLGASALTANTNGNTFTSTAKQEIFSTTSSWLKISNSETTSGTYTGLFIGLTSGYGLEISREGNSADIIFDNTQAGGDFSFKSDATEIMRLETAGNLGIGTVADASALLDVQSTTKGVRFPNMTTTQRDAISSPAAGLVIYNTTTARLNVFTTSWVALH
jgi:hypothetical protein